MSDQGLRVSGRLFAGLVITAVGVLLMLDNLDIVESAPVFRYFPLLVIGIGLAKLFGVWTGPSRSLGSFLVLLGTWLLLNTLDIVSEFWSFWPLFLVLIGGAIVWRSLSRQRDAGPAADSSSRFSSFALMSGIERKNSSEDFRGGDATAVMGGCEIDLRGARIQGGQAVVDTFALWGGVGLKVPVDWKVSGEVIPLMGAFEDNTKTPAGEPKGHLIVKGIAIMGGVEVTN